MRNLTLDRMKSILMYVVTLGHTLYFLNGSEYMLNALYLDNYLGEFIRCVQMPSFMLISGYLFSFSVQKLNKTSFISGFLNMILKGSLVPIIVIGLLTYLIEDFYDYSIIEAIHFIWNKWWFFKVLLFLKIIFMVGHLVFKDNILFGVAVFCCFLLMPEFKDNNFIQLTAMFPYYAIGFYFAQTYKKKFAENPLRVSVEGFWVKWIAVVIIWFGMFIIADRYLDIYDIAISRELLTAQGIIELLYSIVLKVTAFIWIYLLIWKISDRLPEQSWGRYTMFVYPFHCLVVDLVMIKGILNNMNWGNQWLVSIRSIIIALGLWILSNLIAKQLYKYKVCRVLLWGKN